MRDGVGETGWEVGDVWVGDPGRLGEVRKGSDQGNQDEEDDEASLVLVGDEGDDVRGVAGPRDEIVESEPDDVGRSAVSSTGTTRKALGKRVLFVFAGTKRVGVDG